VISAVDLVGAKKDKGFGVNRVCAEDDCQTVLSRYNQNDKCSLHFSVWMNR